MQCSSCATDLPQEARYCPNCGSIVPYNEERQREPLVADLASYSPQYRQATSSSSLPDEGAQQTPSNTSKSVRADIPSPSTTNSLPVASQPSTTRLPEKLVSALRSHTDQTASNNHSSTFDINTWKEKIQKNPIIVIIGIICSILVVLATVITSFKTIWEVIPSPPIQLVDTSFIETEYFPQLDIKVRNTGEQVAVLKRVDLDVQKLWVLQNPCKPSAVPISEKYDVKLITGYAPYTEQVRISQEVQPNGVARFALILGNNAGPGLEEYVFLMKVTIIYNEDNRSVPSQNLLLFSEPSASQILGTNCSNDAASQATMANNQTNVNDIEKIVGIKSERLQKVINAIKKGQWYR